MSEKKKLEELFGEKEVTEDSIMGEARRIFKYQESVGNPYSMHVAFEFVTKEFEKLKQSAEAHPHETIVMWHSVNDGLPDNSVWVLRWSNKWSDPQTVFQSGGIFYDHRDELPSQPTHWAELIEPPQAI